MRCDLDSYTWFSIVMNLCSKDDQFAMRRGENSIAKQQGIFYLKGGGTVRMHR